MCRRVGLRGPPMISAVISRGTESRRGRPRSRPRPRPAEVPAERLSYRRSVHSAVCTHAVQLSHSSSYSSLTQNTATEVTTASGSVPVRVSVSLSHSSHTKSVSVLGLLLGQGAEWKIQTESQHKEWKNMTQK